ILVGKYLRVYHLDIVMVPQETLQQIKTYSCYIIKDLMVHEIFLYSDSIVAIMHLVLSLTKMLKHPTLWDSRVMVGFGYLIIIEGIIVGQVNYMASCRNLKA